MKNDDMAVPLSDYMYIPIEGQSSEMERYPNFGFHAVSTLLTLGSVPDRWVTQRCLPSLLHGTCMSKIVLPLMEEPFSEHAIASK